MRGYINGLDLFSGIGGITIALRDWVRPVAYCEIEEFAQAVLVQRMAEGKLPRAPIWNDVKTLQGKDLPKVDIIYGGFPCQDISVARNGVGLEGERSGLFFEIVRLAEEIKPAFIFLENVPAIRTRGASRVGKELAEVGYDCRWDTLSAEAVGAHHKRQRWFMLASNANCKGFQGFGRREKLFAKKESRASCKNKAMADSKLSKGGFQSGRLKGKSWEEAPNNMDSSWWFSEPNVGRVVNGLPFRVDRIKGLGNAVVPLQARVAFERLLGFEDL